MHIIVILIVIYLAIKFILWCAGVLYSTRPVVRMPTIPTEPAWWFMLNGEARGPVEKSGLQQLFVDGALSGATHVRAGEMSSWMSAKNIEEFASHIAAFNNSLSESFSDPELRKTISEKVNRCDTTEEKYEVVMKVILDKIAEVGDPKLYKNVNEAINHSDTVQEKCQAAKKVLLDYIAELLVKGQGSAPSRVKSDLWGDQPPVKRVVPISALTASQSLKVKPDSTH
jgi:hypothetical protein